MMDKMLFFAKHVATILKAEFEALYDTGYKLLSFSEDYTSYGGTRLFLKEGEYVILEELGEGMDEYDLHCEVHHLADIGKDFSDYKEDYDADADNLEAILFPNDFLYEILYDFGQLGESFHDKEKDAAVKRLLSKIQKVAAVFDYELRFLDGRIYILFERKPLDDGSFIYEDMAEVEAAYQLMTGEGILAAQEKSGMSIEDFRHFLNRLELHELMQTTASEDTEFIEAFKRKKGLD